ncbi:PucR family transcriptional regulator [Bacillus altitudinis]|uniref:PucR family transcriptional regulator n=1 Tax=Bacillus altitudinis TaxID=293387 RepID=UPI0004216C2A|nr:PucR family transcriptional regulator [Bacillus altitudinis]MDR4200293.1 PucR family transcriptional regulator [Bacillus altitudinis]MEE3606042.1 PucR family transcriptional regulator ligand-binding domain-containing protein [Bacillus altitudinis]MEE3612309.1 PucR family transcriptional regulator ligand-binding domain-containing protein [Bacillus altitudinis]MEE3648486.1 PucR family transcriptional regulator ligand-binding domain-containing protein [Bacillus altitudinis]MEE4392204.1 PucR fa
MAILVKDALSLDMMKETKLLAGENGLDRLIQWVTIVEIIEDTSRLSEGELLVTTGFGLTENKERRIRLEQLIQSHRLSAIAIYKGVYLTEIPASLIEAAENSDIPLIEIPPHVNFSDITKAVLEQIVSSQLHQLKYSSAIHQRLTHLNVSNKNVTQITDELAHLTAANIVVLDVFLHQTAAHLETDEVTYSPAFGFLTDDEPIETSSLLKQAEEKGRLVYDTYGAFVLAACPVIAMGDIFGFIVALKKKETWHHLDAIAIEHAGAVYAIEWLKQKAIQDTENQMQGHLLDDMLQQQYTEESYVIEQARKLQYDMSEEQVVIYFQFQHQHTQLDHQMVQRLSQLLTSIFERRQIPFLLKARLDSIFVLTPAGKSTYQETNWYRASEECRSTWSYFFPVHPIVIGIGRAYDQISLFAKSAKEAQYAARLLPLLKTDDSIIHYQKLGLYGMLLEMNEAGMNLHDFYVELLSPLLYTKKQGADLIHTLEVYLAHNENIQKSAGELFIHRHTLSYRLKQIETRTGCSLKSTDDRMKLQLSIMAYRLSGLLDQMRTIS